MPDPIDIQENRLLSDRPAVLEALLADHSTQQSIFWATNSYAARGEGYGFGDPITVAAITGCNGNVIRPRAVKAREEQQQRSREMAEVFTPSWLCNEMNDVADDGWADRLWQDYVQTTRLEITCGEAPFLVSRYDTVSGDPIALDRRIGLLDRKLRVVSAHVADEAEWSRWALLALGSCYGYEWQGDSLLLAREAVVETFAEYFAAHFGHPVGDALLTNAAEIVSWNLWQMDGLKGVVPGSCRKTVIVEPGLFGDPQVREEGCAGCASGNITQHNGIYCRLRRWVADEASIMPAHFDFSFLDIIKGSPYIIYRNKRWPMKFDFIIGNPPYQDETVGEQKTFMSPIYDRFMEASFSIGDKVELITPARFLFNAGSTPSAWNKKMLSDPHLKVLKYESDCSKVFNNTEIKGGVAVTYRDKDKDFGPIEVFTPYQELNSILHKAMSLKKGDTLSDIAVSRTAYRLTDVMHKENPNAIALLSKGHSYDMSTNIFDALPFIFFEAKPDDGKAYIRIIGRQNNERTTKYIRRDYVNDVPNLDFYKVLLPEASGNGKYGEELTTPIIGEPGLANTETFMSLGKFKTRSEAEHLSLYIKTKFQRALLGILKATQHITPAKFQYVPLQDFTSSSDIDWTKNIHEIDLQLYDKYGLSDAECAFIETHVKAME
jgi:hypothetical protein